MIETDSYWHHYRQNSKRFFRKNALKKNVSVWKLRINSGQVAYYLYWMVSFAFEFIHIMRIAARPSCHPFHIPLSLSHRAHKCRAYFPWKHLQGTVGTVISRRRRILHLISMTKTPIRTYTRRPFGWDRISHSVIKCLTDGVDNSCIISKSSPVSIYQYRIFQSIDSDNCVLNSYFSWQVEWGV